MIKLTENVMRLGNRHFNFFVVGQKEAAIVECGVTGGVTSLSKQWLQMEGKPAIRYLITSHAHFDHVCGIPALRDLYPQAQVLASKEAQKVLSKTKIINNFFQQDEKMSAVLLAEGLVADKITSPSIEAIVVDQTLEEGDSIDLRDGLRLQVIASPGHSPCSLAYYFPTDQVMFLSDAGGFQISDEDLFPVFFQGYEMYIETIKRLMGFPTRILGIAHERLCVKSEIESFYMRALESARSAFRNIETMLNNGMNEDEMKQVLFSTYYQGNLRIYTPENINACIELLIRRVKESL
ncbi:MAG: Zn-dependent hydrolase [Firmicutes bacterium HGW-Firmicutes-15]|nr:MAG: Zn-dependent hydrolase [Firmicutes bacterium HGW-Firmicutes-15]